MGPVLVLVLVVMLVLLIVGPHYTTGNGWQLMPLTRDDGGRWSNRHHALAWIALAIIVAVILNVTGVIR